MLVITSNLSLLTALNVNDKASQGWNPHRFNGCTTVTRSSHNNKKKTFRDNVRVYVLMTL